MQQKKRRTFVLLFCTPSGARRLLATSPRECRSRHLWRCGSTTEVTLPIFESTNGVDCFLADVVLQQQNMSGVMIGANLCADLSSLYSLHAPRATAPKQKGKDFHLSLSVPPQGVAYTRTEWRRTNNLRTWFAIGFDFFV